MNRKLYVLGAGGLGKEIASYVKYINSDYILKGFFDDNKSGKIGELESVVGQMQDMESIEKDSNLVIGIGDPTAKKAIYGAIKKKDQFRFPSFLLPNTYVADTQSLQYGKGSIICANSALTVDIQLGEFVLINLGCTIGHDVRVGDFSSVMPGVNLSGNVTIGKGVLIGAGATVLQGITIEDGAVVGAGAVVTRDVKKGSVVKGVPAQ